MLKSVPLLLTALLLLAGMPLAARTVAIRTGKVVCAEVSSTAPEILWSSPDDRPEPAAQAVYAVVMIRLEAGRSFNLVDYQLKINGKLIPAAAAAKNLDPFRSSLETLRPGSLDTVKLLFVLEPSLCSATANTSAQLVSLLPGQPQSTAITLSGIGNRNFTVPAAIPEQGALR